MVRISFARFNIRQVGNSSQFAGGDPAGELLRQELSYLGGVRVTFPFALFYSNEKIRAKESARSYGLRDLTALGKRPGGVSR